MLSQNPVRLRLYLLILVTLASIMMGCTPSSQDVLNEVVTVQSDDSAVNPTVTSTDKPTLTSEPTMIIRPAKDTSTPFPPPSLEQEPDDAVEQDAISTPISSLAQTTNTPTITPAPTLTVDQEGALLTGLMTNNNGCTLPCWWEVIPGQAEPQVVRDMFASKGVDDWSLPVEGTKISMGLGYPRSDSSYYSNDVIVQFSVRNEIIQYVEVHGGYRREDMRPTFVSDWKSYSPTEMLHQYGLPTYVEFAKIENSPYYRLILSYDLLGIEIVYILLYEYLDNGGNEICFELENVDFIHLILYPLGESDNVPEPIIPNRLENYISWETTTGSDIEAFQHLFENADSPPCTELNFTPPNK